MYLLTDWEGRMGTENIWLEVMAYVLHIRGKMLGECDGLASHLDTIFLVASCYRNRVKLRPFGLPVAHVGYL